MSQIFERISGFNLYFSLRYGSRGKETRCPHDKQTEMSRFIGQQCLTFISFLLLHQDLHVYIMKQRRLFSNLMWPENIITYLTCLVALSYIRLGFMQEASNFDIRKKADITTTYFTHTHPTHIPSLPSEHHFFDEQSKAWTEHFSCQCNFLPTQSWVSWVVPIIFLWLLVFCVLFQTYTFSLPMNHPTRNKVLCCGWW